MMKIIAICPSFGIYEDVPVCSLEGKKKWHLGKGKKRSPTIQDEFSFNLKVQQVILLSTI